MKIIPAKPIQYAPKNIFLSILAFLCLFSQNLFAQKPATSVNEKTLALFEAIRSGSTNELQKQLASGADPNDSLNSYSPLMAAILNGTVEQMKILIDHGANVNYATSQGITALWLAVPDWDKTNLLLDHGADVNHTIDGFGILTKLAEIPGTTRFFHLFIEKGADLKKQSADNFLFYSAAASGDTSLISFLLSKGFNVNDTTFFGDYPIDATLGYKSFDALKMLVDHGANVNVQPKSFFLKAFNGLSPLMYAALNNDKPSFDYLLKHGADSNLKSEMGYTALMLLQESETDDPEMTLALLKHGAKVSDKAQDGTDAMFYAQRKGDTRSVELLKKADNK